MKKILFLITGLLILAGCNNSNSIKISGVYNGEKQNVLYLARVDIDVTVPIDSIVIKKSGKFSVSFDSDQINFYNLGFNSKEYITLIASPGDRIELLFRGDILQDDYIVTGSPESEKVKLLDTRLLETYSRMDSLENEFKLLEGSPGFDTILPVLEEKYLQVVKDQRMNNIAFILDNLNSFSSIKALYQRLEDGTNVLYNANDLQYFKLVSDTLNKYYPDSKQAKALRANLEKELNELYMDRITALTENIEPASLDIELQDINGKITSLSSLKGKSYVLLSFWSAQSQECISNNIQMKEFYKTYHRDGFEIYQVNLDMSEELWKSAVNFDELPWISVRDYEDGYSKAATLYNIKTVPANYLIDPEGQIIGKNLFGRALQIKLSQLFN